MICLGVYGRTLEPGRGILVHDSGASLFVDGYHVCSTQEERFSRDKQDDRYPEGAIAAVLGKAGLKPADVQVLSVAQTPQIHFVGADRIAQWWHECFPNAQIRFVGHHHAHAAATFLASPFERATVMTFDNTGDMFPLPKAIQPPAHEKESGVTGIGDRKLGVRILSSVRTSPLIGARQLLLGPFYELMSRYCYTKAAPERSDWMFRQPPAPTDPEAPLYWKRMNALPGKIMGLAGHGSAEAVKLPPIFRVQDDGFNLPQLLVEDWCAELIRTLRFPPQILNAKPEDVAAWAQREFEEAVVAYFRAWPLKERFLCLAGGCALNVLTNRRILDEGLFEDLFVFPGASDCGLSFGAAAHASWLLDGRAECPENVAALGLEYGQADVDQAFRNAGFSPECFENDGVFLDRVADCLISGVVVGWHQGPSEFGPRALGFRSMLADACRPDIREHLNTNIKKREWWRPFAPIVLEEHAGEWFDIDRPSPYMLLSAKVRADKVSQVPGIVHADGSSRVQTVNEKQNPMMYALLRAFHARTGVPMLLNTSFNTDGEPIVESPADAVRTYLRSGIDALAMGRCFLRRES